MKQGNWRINRSKSMTPEGRREYYNRVKTEVFTLLGGQCFLCSFNDHRALQIDHINSDGAADRKTYSGISYLNYVIKNIEKFQLLCANCNWIKRYTANEVKLIYPPDHVFPVEAPIKHSEKKFSSKQCACGISFTPNCGSQIKCNKTCKG